MVSSLETLCSHCNSANILRKDDFKRLIALQKDAEFGALPHTAFFCFVLLEFVALRDESNRDILVFIRQVDPHVRGFAFCRWITI